MFTRDYAAATYTAIPLSNPTPNDTFKSTSFSISSLNPIKPAMDFYESISAYIDSWKDYLENLPRIMAEGSVTLMSKLYELCASLILKTPLWIFDNEWFRNTTYQFSAFSLGIVTVLTVVEAIKRMASGMRTGKRPAMKMKDILKRWGLVSIALSGVPFLFQKSFQILNSVSEKVISMGGNTMRAVALPETIGAFDLVTLILFNIALIATVIPVLWANGKRFFDIMVLGVITPFALTAWIFDSYRHLFNQWWNNLKHLSLVQVYYSVFLLILGWFIFGVPTPDTFTGMIIKLLVVVGGFARMANPPRIIADHMNIGKGFDEVASGLDETKKNFQRSKDIIKSITKGPKGIAKAAWDMATPKVSVAGAASRMSRFHGK